ncbi:hypothetical protein, conserved [Eimeria brunetti]|uniref:Uncharacterized protein n=1 Tax=Eimeria brunetti TaxID=51314 RepID=U6LSX5_9EIME|nr:hypothetical protein, conserved [Eimeria brunetti]
MKKTRKANYRPVSRRPKSSRGRFYDLKKNQKDSILKLKWNNNKTVLQNFENINLRDFENQLADDEALSKKNPEKSLNEMDTKIVAKLIEKHKDDYVAMSRDMKLQQLLLLLLQQRQRQLQQQLQQQQLQQLQQQQLQQQQQLPRFALKHEN